MEVREAIGMSQLPVSLRARGLRFTLLCAGAAVSLGGCQTYLHDPQLATSTSNLKSSFEKLEAPGMIAELKQREDAFAGQESRAVLEEGVAARNENLLSFIRTPALRDRRPEQQGTGAQIFRDSVSRSLGTLYFGPPAPGVPAPRGFDEQSLQILFNAPEQIVEASAQVERINSQIGEEIAGYLTARNRANQSLPEADRDQRKTDCESVVASPPNGDLPTELRYQLLHNSCVELVQIKAGLSGPKGLLERAAPSSQIGVAYRELMKLEASKAKGEAEAARLTQILKRVEAKSKETSSLATLNAEIEEARALLEKAQPFGKQVGLEKLSDFIEDLLAAELKQEEGTVPTETTVRGSAALQMLRAIARVDDAFARSPRVNRTNELLLAAARTRHDLRMAQLDLARNESLRQNLEAQINAMLAKAAYLSEAHSLLEDVVGSDDLAEARQSKSEKTRAAAGQALAAYVSAWNEGEIPRRVLTFRATQIRRAAALERAKATEADYRTSLKPVFDELAAYGEGGIKPETIAELLSHLGVAGAILGN